MEALFLAYMAPIMFGMLVVLLLLGFPVAFSLAANGILFGLIGIDLGLLSPALFQALPQRVFGVMGNESLLAVPFFTFMGLILERKDRKSTRLNSSHVKISYAVFCLKKKTKELTNGHNH